MSKKAIRDSSGYIPVLNHLCSARYQKNIRGILLYPIFAVLLSLLLLPISDISGIIAINVIVFLLPAISIWKLANDRKNLIFYLQIKDTELVCLNGNRKVVCEISKKQISGIRICRLEYVAYIHKYGSQMEEDDFIALLFDVKDFCRTPFRISFEEQLTQHYMLIGYRSETAEKLENALAVPVINEIDSE